MAISNAFKFANNILTNGGYDAADLVGAVGGSSDYVKLATSTIAANTTAVTFDGYFSSTYDTYVVYGNSINTDDNAGFEFYLRQSSTNLTGNNYYYSGYDTNSANSSQVHYGHPNNKVNMNRVTSNTTAAIKNSFIVHLFDPNNNNGTHQPEYSSHIFYCRNDGYQADTYLSGRSNEVTTAITGFQIKPSTGNFDNGTIVLYGVKK
jgi:hypothetical protein